jgi:hypothetical protein
MANTSDDTVPRLWRGGPPERASVRAERTRRRKIFLLQALVMGFAGAIFGMFYWIRPIPQPRLVPLFVASPRARMVPPVPMAEADLDLLTKSAIFSKPTAAYVANQDQTQVERDRAELKALWRRDPVVLYVRAQACFGLPLDQDDKTGIKPKPQVLLFLADSDVTQARSWLPLEKLLNDLAKDCPSRQKLLILDLARPIADPALGIFDQDLPARIREQVDAVKDDYRVVLMSCASGQVSLHSEDLGLSVFNYYLEDGLRGWADVAPADGGPRDGIVTVKEVAEYVKTRVDRWARMNRVTRQTPELLPEKSALDFPLVVLNRGRTTAHRKLPDARVYPPWLLAGWKTRDGWLADSSYRLAPRAIQRLEAYLTRAEREWRTWVDPKLVEKRLSSEVTECTELLKAAKALKRPEARSIGMNEGLGRKIDPEAYKEVTAFRQRWEQMVRTNKPDVDRNRAIEDYVKQAAARKDLEVGAAVLREVVATPELGSDGLDVLDTVLRRHRADPAFLETLLYRRLLETKPRPTAAAIRLAMDVATRGERAGAEPVAFPWVRRALDQAAQHRHDGEVLLRELGFAPSDQAMASLNEATDEFDLILKTETAVSAAREALDTASILLPTYAAALDQAPQMDGTWSAAVQVAGELFADLALPPTSQGNGVPSSLPDLRPRIDRLVKRTEALRDALGALRLFAERRAAEALQRSAAIPGEPSTCIEIDSILASPYPTADQRARLWAGYQRVSRSLIQTTIELDSRARGPVLAATESNADSESESGSDEAFQSASQARRSLALLALGGYKADSLFELLKSSVKSENPTLAWAELGRSLRLAWLVKLPEAIAIRLQAHDLSAADRLARIVPPLLPMPRLDDPKSNPALQLRARIESDLWAWLADRYAYDAHDLGGSRLADEAARECRRVSGQVTARPSVLFARATGEAELSPDRPKTTLTVPFQVLAPTESRPDVIVDILRADADWIAVKPTDIADGGLGTAFATGASSFPIRRKVTGFDALTVPLEVMLEPGDHSKRPVPRGFLTVATIDGRPFYARVPLRFGEAEPWNVWMSDEPDIRSTPLDQVRLRPTKGRQTYYLFVVNPSDRPRAITLELRSGEGPLSGAAGTFTIAANATRRMVFPPPTAPPTAAPPATPAPAPAPTASSSKEEPELPEVRGPLEVRIHDGDLAAPVVMSRRFDIDIASPTEYVRIASARFNPPGPANAKQNLLEVNVRAAGPLKGPPCPVELVLPRDGIPGFRGVEDGKFKGILPDEGGRLALFASGIRLDEVSSQHGSFYLNIDSRPRALWFQTTYARQGAATTPQLDITPRVRLTARSAALPGASFDVDLQVDNPPTGSQIELSLGRDTLAGFEPDVVQPTRPARRRRIGGAVLDNELVFEASDRDWTIPIETGGLEGRRRLRARLLAANGQEILVVTQPVVLDSAPPRSVRFQDPPARVKKGTSLTLRAVCAPSESGVKEAVFFIGRPVDDKRPTMSAPIEAKAVDPEHTTWEAKVPIPPDRTGPLDVSAEIVSGVGKSAFGLTTIEVSDADPISGGGLQGHVYEGDRPQPDLVVYLGDAKGVVKAQATTDGEGRYEFSNIEPGKYRVLAIKTASRTRRDQIVDIEGGETKTVDLELLR